MPQILTDFFQEKGNHLYHFGTVNQTVYHWKNPRSHLLLLRIGYVCSIDFVEQWNERDWRIIKWQAEYG